MGENPTDERVATLRETVGELRTPEYLAELLTVQLTAGDYPPGLPEIAGGLLKLIRAAHS
jgi:hypothetical protein